MSNPPAKGYQKTKNGMKRILVSLDQETFDIITKRAARAHQSFAATARELIEWGLQA